MENGWGQETQFGQRKAEADIETCAIHLTPTIILPSYSFFLVSSIHGQDPGKERGKENDTSSVCHFTLNRSRHGQSNPDSPGERDWCSVQETFIK